MKKFLHMLPLILLMGSCSGQNNKSTSNASQLTDQDDFVCPPIEGMWLLKHVVVNDTLELRPADVDPESKLYAYFYNDSTFSFQTGCNAIGGRYIQTNDTISISDLMGTAMACEDMRIEELLGQVLPQVNSVDWNNDSIMRLNTQNSAYVVLKKCEDNVKSVEPEH